MEQKAWIALGAASALGLGVLAGGAVTAATAMPLVESTTTVDVAPISNVRGDVKSFAGWNESRITVPGSTPAPGSSPSASPTPSTPTASAADPTPAPAVTQAPAPQPIPAAPAPAPAPVDSVASPISPASAD